MGNSYTLEIDADIDKTIKNLDSSTTSIRRFDMPNVYWANSNIRYQYFKDGITNFVSSNAWRNLEKYPFSFYGNFETAGTSFFISPTLDSLINAEINSFRYRGVYTNTSGQTRSPWLPCFANTGLLQPLALSYTENGNFYSLTAMSFEIKYTEAASMAGVMSSLYSMLPFTGSAVKNREEVNGVDENKEKNENEENIQETSS